MFFKDVKKFPSVENEIEFLPFIEACKGIVKFVELLGSLFAPVRHDIQGNIDKLSKIHFSNAAEFPTINSIVEFEVKRAGDQTGIDALLWLKSKQEQHEENISSFFYKAYEEKLKPYHGWIVQKLFGLMVVAAPSRKSLLDLLAGGEDSSTEDVVFGEMEIYLEGLGANIDVINRLYDIHNLVFNQKV
ncbi:glycolipid transfer protein-like isoform X2 [Argiope bruennichi]|uniref:glycolipid transfer protein-like isoform X2 n=1 Tax=Argiope bruennichi TaxID=94029 RepID=UPI002494F0D9|nr:glycolipid transfer protein-like isoform X2 [Argiope bruennichi]